MRYNGNDDDLFEGLIVTDREIGHFVAVFFLLGCALAGTWDFMTYLFGNQADTVSEIIRNSWMRWPMAVLVISFFIAHFWLKK